MKPLNIACLIISGVCLAVMVVLIVVDVALRGLINAPLPATMEISQVLEAFLVFLPFAYTLATGGHVKVTLIIGRFGGRAGRFFHYLAYGANLTFFAILTYASWRFFWESFLIKEVMLAAIAVPWWLSKLAMPLGLGLIGIQCLHFLSSAPAVKGDDA